MKPWTIALTLIVIVMLATGGALAIRFLLIEPEHVAQSCAANAAGFRCWLRHYVVQGFLTNSFGMTAVICGVLATIARWRWLAAIAIVVGICGAVFYKYELSGLGLLLGMLVWVQSRTPSAEEQRAG